MKCNEGKIDRTIRVILGIALIAGGYFLSAWWLYILGGILLATGLTGFCLLYVFFKINTCKK
ncbi:MAG: DUF2892 domain-containing protein [bacterium]|nr:DUF2892 domain-containing protein [bacterium]